MGKASIFREKIGGDRIQGVITHLGSEAFEAARAQLAHLVGRLPGQVSDGDVIEALARGWAATEAYVHADVLVRDS